MTSSAALARRGVVGLSSTVAREAASSVAGPSRQRCCMLPSISPCTRCCVQQRLLSTSSSARAAQRDFYAVLDVPRTASQTDIKRQFYQLSKKYHPDMNRDDDGAKQKFQEVSEAYATIGNERSRRAYDANRSSYPSSGSGYSSYSTTGGASSMNAERRARAAYAWDYTRRRSDSPRSTRGSGSGSAHHDPRSSSSSSSARPGFTAYGRGGVGPESSFGFQDEHPADRLERMAEQLRRRRSGFERGAAGGGGGSSADGGDHAQSQQQQQQQGSGEGGNAIFRFLQGSGIFLAVLWLGSLGNRTLGSSRSGIDDRKRTGIGQRALL